MMNNGLIFGCKDRCWNLTSKKNNPKTVKWFKECEEIICNDLIEKGQCMHQKKSQQVFGASVTYKEATP